MITDPINHMVCTKDSCTHEVVMSHPMDMYGAQKDYAAVLRKCGRFSIKTKDEERDYPWYKDPETGKPFFPSDKNFKSLVKEAVRDGDYDEIISPKN